VSVNVEAGSSLVLTHHRLDRGGTFTDCIATVPGQDDIVLKLLSVDPSNYKDAPVEAVRRVLEKATGKSYPKNEKIPVDEIGKLPNCSGD
jgi:N-methylhydantoinase A/oxoprolinase/acetone carboxylase beta subunit